MPRQNTSPADYPQAVLQQIEQLAQNIVIARKRRGESQAQWAKKLGISQPTMARIERGDPSVAMASYVMCMWLINQAGGLADLIAPQNDHAALEKEVAKIDSKRKSSAPKKNKPSTAATKAASPQPSTSETKGLAGLVEQMAKYALEQEMQAQGDKKTAAAAGLAALMNKSTPQKL